ncbi:MAG: hypothetical protein M3Z54_12440 [Gemmatimonadota bacterium]|nr:hypothetical protein [Gemmatimonadota bacterium]
MSIALQNPDIEPPDEHSAPPYRLSDTELRLRSQFIAAFNDTPQPSWEFQIAVWDLTDELRRNGELAEGVVKRIKYISAIPISFHYRVGYKPCHSRLTEAVSKAVSLSIARYFADDPRPRRRER